MESRYIPILFSTQSLKKVSGQTQGGSCGGSSRYIRPTRSHILSTACIRIWIRARKNVSESVLLLSFFFDRAQYHSYSIEMICSVYIYVRVQFEQELVQGLWRTKPLTGQEGKQCCREGGGREGYNTADELFTILNNTGKWYRIPKNKSKLRSTLEKSGKEYKRTMMNIKYWTMLQNGKQWTI